MHPYIHTVLLDKSGSIDESKIVKPTRIFNTEYLAGPVSKIWPFGGALEQNL